MPKIDTVGDNYYKPLRWADTVGAWLFWVGAILSVAALLIDRASYPHAHDLLQIAFIACALLFFVQGQAQRLYFFPRAEDRRRQELLSNSYGVKLIHEETIGYYNNDQAYPLKRLAASVMESAFFTGEIARRMLAWERTKVLGYLTIYILAVFNRSTDLELLAVAAQVLFSEAVLSRWLRMEWLRVRSEQVFDNLNRVFTSGLPP